MQQSPSMNRVPDRAQSDLSDVFTMCFLKQLFDEKFVFIYKILVVHIDFMFMISSLSYMHSKYYSSHVPGKHSYEVQSRTPVLCPKLQLLPQLALML